MAVSREVASYQGQQEIVDAINGFTLSGVAQKAVWFDSVSSMQRADIPAGATAATRGYTTVNDGGNAFYYIREKTQSDVEDGGSIIFLDNENVAELITDGTVTPEQFGAKGDGTTECTTALQNLFAYGGIINMPSTAVYMVDTVTKGRINLVSNTVVYGNGAKIQEVTHDTVTSRKEMLYLYGLHDVLITHLNVEGYLEDVVATIIDSDGFCDGFAILNCQNVTIDKCTISWMIGDGIYSGNYVSKSKNVLIKDCVIHHCHRHAIASTGTDDFVVDNCDIYAVYWLCGIDIESGVPGVYSSNILIKDCYIHDFITKSFSNHVGIMLNDGVNVNIVGGDIFSVIVKVSVNINDSKIGSLGFRVSDGCTIENSKITYMGVGQDNKVVNFKNCVIGNASGTFSAATIAFNTDGYGSNTTTEAIFENCRLIGKNQIDGSAAYNSLVYTTAYMKKLKFQNCYVEINNGLPLLMYANDGVDVENCIIKLNTATDVTGYSAIDIVSNTRLVDNVIDALEISSTTSNGFIYLRTGTTYAIGNTVLSASALGGTYNGNLFRTTGDTTLYAINNNAPAYAVINGGVGTPTVYKAGNVLSGDLT